MSNTVSNRELLAGVIAQHLTRSGDATASPMSVTIDATTREPYAASFTLDSPLGRFRIIVEDRPA